MDVNCVTRFWIAHITWPPTIEKLMVSSTVLNAIKHSITQWALYVTRTQHKKPRFHCICGVSFAFSSQLQSHSAVHRRHATHHCIYPGCGKSFKHKGDLKRHASEHYSSAHECPDCDYKHHDIRNLESHRLTHTDIEKYTCQKCGQKFKFNTQLRHHLKTPNKCIGRKRSDSPEY